MKKLRIGGVPEHFNLPWHLYLESNAAAAIGVDASWRDVPEGSGAMAASLRQGELDVAMLLTEGAIAGIAGGGGFSIVSCYTVSPLVWGIHVPAESRFETVADIAGARYAISRRGSGSHLMCAVHAEQRRWPTDSLDLVVVGNLEGAIDAFATDRADVFFWEKFMTKPLVDSGQFRRVGEFVAPWPAFVVCASDRAVAEDAAEIRALLSGVFGAARELSNGPDAARLIAGRYGLELRDVEQWLKLTRWAERIGVSAAQLEPPVTALRDLELIPASFEPSQAVTALPVDD